MVLKIIHHTYCTVPTIGINPAMDYLSVEIAFLIILVATVCNT